MGKENDVMLEYLEDNERFADLFNGDFFQGEQVVRAEELSEGSEVYVERWQAGETDQVEEATGVAQAKPRRRKVVKATTRTRDIKKRLRSGGVLRILAIENQNLVNYAMPWRHMNYDCLEYGKQIRNRRKENKKKKSLSTPAERMCGLRMDDKIAPTYTICLYHGTERWDGPRSLKDMMDFGEGGERWEELFADYRMHLICINEIEDFTQFHSPLREFLQLLSCREDEGALKKLLTENPAFERIDEETARAVNILMGEELFMGKKNEKEETYNMCGAVRAIRREGKNAGLAILGSLNERLVDDGRMEDLMRSIKDKAFRDQLLQEYGLLDDEEE